MKRDVPYAIMLPIVVVCFAVVLMIWATSGTSGGRSDNVAGTTGAASTPPTVSAVRVPTGSNNDTAADSARTTSPLNKSR
jgi:hypothetical protein